MTGQTALTWQSAQLGAALLAQKPLHGARGSSDPRSAWYSAPRIAEPLCSFSRIGVSASHCTRSWLTRKVSIVGYPDDTAHCCLPSVPVGQRARSQSSKRSYSVKLRLERVIR